MRRLAVFLVALLSPIWTHAADGFIQLAGPNVTDAALLSDGRALVGYYDPEVAEAAWTFATVGLDDGATQLWDVDWEPANYGWSAVDSGWQNFAVSPDGQTVLTTRTVGVAMSGETPEDDWTYPAVAIVASNAEGAHARAIALAELTDGGPRLYFSQDGRYLVGPWFFECEPTPEGLRGYFNRDWDRSPPVGLNAYDFQRGELVLKTAIAGAEWLDKSPYSDAFVYEEMDTIARHYGYLAGPNEGMTGSFLPPSEDSYVSQASWVGPDLQLLWLDGAQGLVGMSGQTWPAPPGVWVSYCYLPDGRSFFSRDGGHSIELGRVDWQTGAVADALARPDLAQFAGALDEEGWPTRYDTWIALPDGGGALIVTPGMDDGGMLYMIETD